MNCEKFENVMSELARGQMMAAEQRGAALAHSDACEKCAARLHDEEMLTSGLQSLAAEMGPFAAPDAVEARVLGAFRARKTVVPITRRQSNTVYWLAAVAAMLLIAISVAVFRWNAGTVDSPRQAIKQAEPQPKPEITRERSEQLVKNIEDETSNPAPQRRRPRRIHPSTRRAESAQVANHVTNEIATDFIPLSYMSAANLQDGGQIVRVQLPRSALAKFGLPVNMDRYNEKVKADVLFGVDGTARAIRFVQ